MSSNSSQDSLGTARAGRAAAATTPRSKQQQQEERERDRLSCRVPGCGRELRAGFLMRCRCCEYHSRAPQIELAGMMSRFCQQCGFFHPLEEFDDQRRSCRRSLERHRVCRRLRRQKAAETAAAVSAFAAHAIEAEEGEEGTDAADTAPEASLQDAGGTEGDWPAEGAAVARRGAKRGAADAAPLPEDAPLPTPQFEEEVRKDGLGGKPVSAARAAPGADAAPAAAKRRRSGRIVKYEVGAAWQPALTAADDAGTVRSGSGGGLLPDMIRLDSAPGRGSLLSCSTGGPPSAPGSARLLRRETPAAAPLLSVYTLDTPSAATADAATAGPPKYDAWQCAGLSAALSCKHLPPLAPWDHSATTAHAPDLQSGCLAPCFPPHCGALGSLSSMAPGGLAMNSLQSTQLGVSSLQSAQRPVGSWDAAESWVPAALVQGAVPIVEDTIQLLRAPTPAFNDVPSLEEMMALNADLGMLSRCERLPPLGLIIPLLDGAVPPVGAVLPASAVPFAGMVPPGVHPRLSHAGECWSQMQRVLHEQQQQLMQLAAIAGML